MTFFRILDSFDVPGGWYLDDPKTKDGRVLDPRLFTEGREYRGYTVYPGDRGTGAPPATALDCSNELPLQLPVRKGLRPLDFTLGSFDMPVVVERVAARLAPIVGRSVQWIPATVTGFDLRFMILNVLTVLDAVDDEHSEITRWTSEDGHPLPERIGTYAGIGRLVLRRDVVGHSPTFRLKNWEVALVVSQTVKAALEDLQATGIKFQELATH